MTNAASAQETRWRRRKLARPGEILNAALACFAERGFAATRLDEVAWRAGITKGTLYLYFMNKQELFEAVVRQALVPNIERGEALLDDADAPAALLLERLLRGWVELARSPAGALPKIVIAEAGNFPDLARFYRREVVDRGMALLHRVLESGIARGEFRNVDIENAVPCIVAPLLLAMLWRHSFGRHDPAGLDPDALCEAHLRLLLEGLAIPPPGPPAHETEGPAAGVAAGLCPRSAPSARSRRGTRITGENTAS
jgi:AcrR family transcriptional regulator